MSSQAIVEEDDTAVEATLGDQAQLNSNLLGQCRLAAADEDRRQEQLAPVDEPSPERLGSQLRPADGDGPSQTVLHGQDRARIEVALDAGPETRRRLQ